MNKFLFLLLVCAAPSLAQTSPVDFRIAAGCGPAETQFKVTSVPRDKPVPTPAAGKAMVYVIERPIDSEVTVRVGIDANWVGAIQNGAYLRFEVDPGEHRVCADWQSTMKIRQRQGGALVVNVEARKSYYLMATVSEGVPDLTLVGLDEAEGAWVVSVSDKSKWSEEK